MRNPLDEMVIRSNRSAIAFSREKSQTHNVFGHNVRVDATTHLPRDHSGWDLSAHDGTPVYAIASGLITSTWHDASQKNYGNQIQLEFTFKGERYTAFYAHLSEIYVTILTKVGEGAVIGKTGHSGNASNLALGQRHLHFEIRSKQGHGRHGSIDPALILGGSILTCHT